METQYPSETIRSALETSETRTAHQQGLVVAFGQRALSAEQFSDVLNDACVTAAAGLGVKFTKVLRHEPEEKCFLLIAGVGWLAEEIGSTKLAADLGSPAGYALQQGHPVLSNHLEEEQRFRTPALLERYGIKRAINVPIRSTPSPLGVLEADSPDADEFAESDIVFLEGIANIVSFSLQRFVGTLAPESDALSEKILNASTDCIKILSLDGKLQRMNESGLCQMKIDDFDLVHGRAWADLWPESARQMIDLAVEAASKGQMSRFEAFCPTTHGESRWWDVSVSPVLGQEQTPTRIVAVSRDITERHMNEQRLQALVAEQESVIDSTDLMMREVHHRVRNSLQLVQALLTLQATLSTDANAKAQLQSAALRVTTIGTVHQLLYEENGSPATDVSVYLNKLITTLSSTFEGRQILLHAEHISLPAGRLNPLGLITTELIINAVKYGCGTITVTVRKQQDALELWVEDEGSGLPDNFPSPQSTGGLGMRIVKSYSGFGSAAIRADRTVTWSRIIVKFSIGE